MVIMILRRTTPSLRGQLTRWLIEPQAGVFVGNISALVRDKLWSTILEECPDSSAMLLYSAQTEQGFTIRCAGDDTRQPRDFEGITLIQHARENVEDVSH